jgi:hypothetical protein
MKRAILITGILLMLISAGNMNLNAQGNTGNRPDSLNMKRPQRAWNSRQMRPNGPQGNFRGHQSGMMDRSFQGPFGHMGWRFPIPEKNRTEFFQSLTDKQKAELFDLGMQHRAEMKKFREEMVAKMRVMRENQRNKFLGLLTDEQKKLLEPAPGKSNNVSPDVK